MKKYGFILCVIGIFYFIIPFNANALNNYYNLDTAPEYLRFYYLTYSCPDNGVEYDENVFIYNLDTGYIYANDSSGEYIELEKNALLSGDRLVIKYACGDTSYPEFYNYCFETGEYIQNCEKNGETDFLSDYIGFGYVFTYPETESGILAYAKRFFTDLSSLIILAIGLPTAFWIIKRTIALISRYYDKKV